MLIETTHTAKHVDRWGPEDSIAEFLQNCLDAQDEGATISVTWSDGFASIDDTGSGLELGDLASGKTDKADPQNARGGFGIGMKQAMLWFASQQRLCQIRSSRFSIIPLYQKHTIMPIDVLVFSVGDDRQEGTHVMLECSQDELENAKARFASFNDCIYTDDSKVMSLPGGSVYVNGVKVQSIDSLYSYHLTGRENVDNERRFVDKTWLSKSIADCLVKATSAVCDAILTEAKDNPVTQIVECQTYFGYPYKPSGMWIDSFYCLFGSKVVLCDYGANRVRLEYLGYTAVYLPSNLESFLWSKVRNSKSVIFEDAQTSRRDANLTTHETALVRRYIRYLASRKICDPDIDVHIADTLQTATGKDCWGMYTDGIIWLQRSILIDRSQALSTLAHEIAHMTSRDSDGGTDFEAALTGIIAKLV